MRLDGAPSSNRRSDAVEILDAGSGSPDCDISEIENSAKDRLAHEHGLDL